MGDGVITRASGESLLKKFGTFLSPVSKVYKGEQVQAKTRKLWEPEL